MSKKLKLFNIALIGGSIKEGKIQYYASNEEECKRHFLEENPDLDESDFWLQDAPVSGGVE